MKNFAWLFLFLAFFVSVGCGSKPEPVEMTPEVQAEIDSNDAAVEAEEKAQENP